MKVKERPCPNCGNLLDYGSRWMNRVGVVWHRTWTCSSCRYMVHLQDPDEFIISLCCKKPLVQKTAWQQEEDRHGFSSVWKCPLCKKTQQEHRCRYRDIEAGTLSDKILVSLKKIRETERNYHKNVDLIGWNELAENVKEAIIKRVGEMHLMTVIQFPRNVSCIGKMSHDTFHDLSIWYGTILMLGQIKKIVLHIGYHSEIYNSEFNNAIRWIVTYVSVNGFFTVVPCLIKMDMPGTHVAVARMLCHESFFILPSHHEGGFILDDALITDTVFVTQFTNLCVVRDKLPGTLMCLENGQWGFSDSHEEIFQFV